MRVGFAGLGRMGVHMVRNLAAAGFEIMIWNRTARKADELSQALGCRCADSPANLTAWADVVVTMLADDPSSVDVHSGANGLFSTNGATVFVEMGTMSPNHIKYLADHAPTGVTVIDAPVSGATQAAADAQLMIMAGCAPDTAEPLTAIFDAMGRQTICLGEQRAGAVMKLAVNSLIHGINQTLAEAMTLAEASGIPPALAFDAIEASAACAPMLKYRRPLYLDEAAHDVTFTIALACKDMMITSKLAHQLGVAMPQGEVTLAKLIDAESDGFADRDMASMLNYMRQENA